MIQYFGHHHQSFHPFWPRHSLHQKSRCFYKPRISWHTQLLWQNLIGTMIEHNNFHKRYMYFYLPHPQSSALTSLMASKTNPKAKRAIFMLNIILVNSYFVLVGDRNQSHTKSSDFGLFIVIRTLGGFNIVHSNAPQLKIFWKIVLYVNFLSLKQEINFKQFFRKSRIDRSNCKNEKKCHPILNECISWIVVIQTTSVKVQEKYAFS